MAQRRLMNEFSQFNQNKPGNSTANLINDDLYKWEVLFPGPPSTPYEGGIFKVHIIFSAKYPHEKPEIKVITKVYHPSIDENGKACLGEEWSPATKVHSLYQILVDKFLNPNPDGAVNAIIAAELQTDRSKFENTAKEWTRQFAK